MENILDKMLPKNGKTKSMFVNSVIFNFNFVLFKKNK